MMMTHPGWLCNSWESSFRYYTQLYCYRIKGCWMYVDGEKEIQKRCEWRKEGNRNKEQLQTSFRDLQEKTSSPLPTLHRLDHIYYTRLLPSLSYSLSFSPSPLSLSHSIYSITQPDNVATLLLNERHTNATSTHTASVYSHFVSIRKFFIVFFVILHYEGRKEGKNGSLVLGSSDQGRWQTFTVFKHSSRLIQPTDT